ncbi:polysaccharide deacetylase family protein [Streptococcus dysgalactiae]|uniref:Polysaccharide deacetylase n=1 Tax=Streptococcus dysgalactiae TaxID=1334 RepID=A0A9X9SJ84_STRDY|nr:polysaccharide deacetylase family protein [Streptococcus dysgalactiae]VTS25188.1 polysaccharide deacetylase [Streptococcus dysgalactiae subsp. equisimilis]VTS39544.1 polysaccharide deacetylase [Streptococcus dysgalactiae subsp. equisimilis]VTS86464.1 polysaccharide deacetylase [Streptococcus dysgalactiae]
MKKINLILASLLSIVLLGLIFISVNQWEIKKESHQLVLAEKKKSSQVTIKSVKKIKVDQKDYYYFSPLTNADDFFVNNLPVSMYKDEPVDKAVILLKPEWHPSQLKGIHKVTISKKVYQKKWFHLKKVSEKVVSSYHVTDDFQRFALKDLVSGHLERISQEVEKRYPDKAFHITDDDQLNESNHLVTDHFDVSAGHLVLGEGLSIPLSSLFDVINPDFLDTADKVAYDEYIAQKKAEEEAKHPQKLVALTFDDGPDPRTTPQVLDILAKYQAKGTFFMMGSKVAGNEALVKRVSEAGHEIGNHSWDHPNLTKLTVDQIQYQVNATNQAISKACGKKPLYLRPPYGATNDTVQRASGLAQMLWTVDTRDWENHSTAGIMANIKKQLQPGGVVLMHDIHQTTVNALPTVMEYLKAEGYQCVTVSDLYNQH